jgi:hypothetical protein
VFYGYLNSHVGAAKERTMVHDPSADLVWSGPKLKSNQSDFVSPDMRRRVQFRSPTTTKIKTINKISIAGVTGHIGSRVLQEYLDRFFTKAIGLSRLYHQNSTILVTEDLRYFSDEEVEKLSGVRACI